MWHTLMDYYLVSTREKTLANATTQLSHESIMPGEPSQSSKAQILYGSTYVRDLE